ncbi:hypothetical protein RI367_006680 [Sorochytrium milnesiophthora]
MQLLFSRHTAGSHTTEGHAPVRPRRAIQGGYHSLDIAKVPKADKLSCMKEFVSTTFDHGDLTKVELRRVKLTALPVFLYDGHDPLQFYLSQRQLQIGAQDEDERLPAYSRLCEDYYRETTPDALPPTYEDKEPFGIPDTDHLADVRISVEQASSGTTYHIHYAVPPESPLDSYSALFEVFVRNVLAYVRSRHSVVLSYLWQLVSSRPAAPSMQVRLYVPEHNLSHRFALKQLGLTHRPASQHVVAYTITNREARKFTTYQYTTAGVGRAEEERSPVQV